MPLRECRPSLVPLNLVTACACLWLTVFIGFPGTARADFWSDAGHALEKAAQDTGHAIEKGTQDTGRAVEKGAHDTGNTLEKAAHDTGNTAEKAAHDTGHTLEKASQDTGRALETAAHDTGHALEKAGQDVGHLFEQLINFHLACSLPQSKPADLAQPYKAACGSDFSTYSNDIDVCNGAGGASVIAAVAGGAAGLGAAATGGGTYVIAKVAFELCQKACRSQASLNQCVANVDQSAKTSATQANEATTKNNDSEAQLALFSCMDDAYAGEKLSIMDSLLAECEASKTCNTQSSNFSDDFISKSVDANKTIDARRVQALATVRSGSPVKLDYGPYIASSALGSISLTAQKNASPMICRVRDPNVMARIQVKHGGPTSVTIKWVRESVTVIELNAATDPSGVVNSLVNLTDKGVGKWEMQISAPDNTALGSFGFVFRPDDQ